MIVTDDDALAVELRRIRHHGSEPKYVHHRLGGNFRLDTLQAAVLDVKLDHVSGWIAARKRHAAAYDEALPADIRPGTLSGNDHAWHQYTIRVPNRDAFREQLRVDGIETQIYYPTSCELQPCFAEYEARIVGDLAVAHSACAEVLALPVFPELTSEERDYVARRLNAHLVSQAA